MGTAQQDFLGTEPETYLGWLIDQAAPHYWLALVATVLVVGFGRIGGVL